MKEKIGKSKFGTCSHKHNQRKSDLHSI